MSLEWRTSHKNNKPFATQPLDMTAIKDEKGLWLRAVEVLDDKEQLKNIRQEFIDDYLTRHGFKKVFEQLHQSISFAPQTIRIYQDDKERTVTVREYTGRQQGRIGSDIDYTTEPYDVANIPTGYTPGFTGKYFRQVDKFREFVEGRQPLKKVPRAKPRMTPLHQIRPRDNIVLTKPGSRFTIEGKVEVSQYDPENRNYKLVIRQPSGEVFDATDIANGFTDQSGARHRPWWVTRVSA